MFSSQFEIESFKSNSFLDGKILQFEPKLGAESPVVDEDENEQEGIVGGPANMLNNLCTLSISEVQLEQFGRWYCYLNSSNLHIGTLTLLNKEKEMYVKDVRLPEHIKPSVYFIDLEPHIQEGDFTIDGTVAMTFTVDENVKVWNGSHNLLQQ